MAQRFPTGFTLIELMIALAIIAILVGLMVPSFATRLSSARVQVAEKDVAAIGKAIDRFFKDVGVWPARSATGTDNSVALLLSGTQLPTSNPWVNNTFWSLLTSSSGDVLHNHLFTNSPAGSVASPYPTQAWKAWRGPYLDPAKNDPWDRPYVVNVISGYSVGASNNRRLWVLSAGPDGEFQTSTTAGVADACQGDDIGFLVHLR